MNIESNLSCDPSLCVWTVAHTLACRRYPTLISLQRLPAPKPAERNGVITTTEVEVAAVEAPTTTATEMVMEMATETEMVTGMATGTETVTGMVMEMVMGMDMETGMVMEMVTEMEAGVVAETTTTDLVEVEAAVEAEEVAEEVAEAEVAVVEEGVVAAASKLIVAATSSSVKVM